MSTIVEELASVVAQLPEREQERVLSFARELAHPPVFPHTPLPPGGSPEALLRLRVDDATGEAMQRAHEDAERIWPDEHIWPDD